MVTLLVWALVVVAWAVFVRSKVLAPDRLLLAFWLVMFAGTATFFPGTFTQAVTLVGFAYILLCVGAFSAACHFAYRGTRRQPNKDVGPIVLIRPSMRTFILIMLVSVVSGLGLFILTVSGRGVSVSNVDQLSIVANQFARERYSGLGQANVYDSVLVSVSLTAALIMPFVRLRGIRRWWILSLVPALSLLPYVVVTTAKLPLIVSLFFTAGSAIAADLLLKGETIRVNGKLLVAAAVTSIAFVGLLFSVSVLRTGSISDETYAAARDNQITYAVASVPAFGLWLADRRDGVSEDSAYGLAWGAATIPGVELVSGVKRSTTRAYNYNVSLGDKSEFTTNVYTGFRQIAIDFGIVGAVVFFALAGHAVGRCASGVVMNSSIWRASIVAIFYSLVPMTASLLPTTFTNVFVAYVAFVIFAVVGIRLTGGGDGASRSRRGEPVFSAANPDNR